jgi:hypothetical protein
MNFSVRDQSCTGTVSTCDPDLRRAARTGGVMCMLWDRDHY